MLALAVLVAKGGFGPAGASPSASVAASLPPAVPVERIAYAGQPQYRPADAPTCDPYQESRLRLIAPDGGEIVRVMQPSDLWETQPAWSPDGMQLAFVGQTDTASLYVVNANGTGLRNLIPSLPAGVDAAPDTMPPPAWSPDGLRLLFTYGPNGVWLVDADGSDLHQLIAPLAAPPATPDEQGEPPETFRPEFGPASWMPDGRIAVPVTDQVKDAAAFRTILYAAAADGTGLAPLPGMPSGLDLTWPTRGRPTGGWPS